MCLNRFLTSFIDFSSQVKKADVQDHCIFIMDSDDLNDATNVRNHENNKKTTQHIDAISNTIWGTISNRIWLQF